MGIDNDASEHGSRRSGADANASVNVAACVAACLPVPFADPGKLAATGAIEARAKTRGAPPVPIRPGGTLARHSVVGSGVDGLDRRDA